MSDTEKTVIIKIDLDVNEYTKKSVELNKQASELQKTQKELKASGKELSIEYQQNKEKLTSLNNELRQNNKTIQDVTRANQAQSGSNEQLRAQLSILTSQYNKLSAEERTSSSAGIEMGKQVSALTETLKANESQVGDNRRNVGNYKGALSELKAELKLAKSAALEAAAAFGVGSKEFQDATKKAGNLKDQIDDVNAATKEMGTGSALGQFKNQLAGVGRSIADLDFDEAAQKAKGLANTVKGMSFSGVIQGAKGFAVTLYEVAVAMLSIPIVAIVAGLAAIAAAMYFSAKASQESTQVIVDNLQAVSDRYSKLYDVQTRINKAAGLDTEKTEMKKLNIQRFVIDKQIEALEKQQKVFGGLNDEQTKQLAELRTAQLESIADIAEANINSIKNKSAAQKKAFEEDAKLTSGVTAKRIAENQKILDEQRKLNEERLAENRKYMLQVEDQQIELIQNQEDRELAKASLDNARRQEEIAKSKADNDVKFSAWLSQQETYEQQVVDIRQKYAKIKQAEFDKAVQDQIKSDAPRIKAAEDAEKQMEQDAIDSQNAIVDNYLADIKKKEAAEKEFQAAIKRLQQESFDATKTAIDGIAQIRANQREAEIVGIEEETKVKIDNLQAQADAGIITQDEFQTKSNRIKMDAAKQESVIKKKQFEESKKVALIQVAIKTAQGVMTAFNAATPYEIAAYVALALATGALEAAVIQSQPTPAFAEGGKALSGKKISSGDGKPIRRSNGDNLLATVKTGEVILNERQQRMLGGSNVFKKIGVPGFASGGLTDGGMLANSLSGNIDEQIAAQNQALIVAQNLPQSVVFVQDISQKTSEVSTVEARADI
jgi:hypothetical protein